MADVAMEKEGKPLGGRERAAHLVSVCLVLFCCLCCHSQISRSSFVRQKCQNGLVFAGMAKVPAGKEFLGNNLQKNRHIVAGIPF
jgi:hypothetical protein